MSLWKEIMKEAAALREFSAFAVGDGRRICFWEDKWCGSEPLGVAFPSLYSMTVDKGAHVAYLCDNSREVPGRWRVGTPKF